MLGEARPIARRVARATTGLAARGLPPWVIPFDYAATFNLTGQPGNVSEAAINISSDGVFVATAIGYGLDEDRTRSIQLLDDQTNAPLAKDFLPGDLKLGQIPAEGLVEGFRIAPRLDSLVFGGPGAQAGGAAAFTQDQLSKTFVSRVVQRLKIPKEISFLFSIVDSSSGRELQDQPAHNLASLGISNGERPFRTLAYPLAFAPRSTLRLQVIERSEDTRGILFIVLMGYRVVTGSQCPEVVTRAIAAAATASQSAAASKSLIPFDYVATVPLSGRPDSLVEAEVPINAEGAFIATGVAYGLEPANDAWELLWDTAKPALSGVSTVTPRDLQIWDENKRVDLAKLPLKAFPREVLRDGLRIRSSYVRFAFASSSQGVTLGSVALAMVPELFESLNSSEAVSFRYEIFDSGSGRDLQNEAVHNVAGLGIANGDRPFKRFARPMVFVPRSTMRIRVQERFGRGNLHFALHGYKLLGVGGGAI